MDEENKIQRSESAAPDLERPRPASGSPYETVETGEALDLLVYWRVIRKRRWTILTIFLVLLSVVLIGTLLQEPIYRAEALLEITKENPDLPTVGDLFELGEVSDTHLETQYKILQSTSLARSVIEQLSLGKLPEFDSPSFFPWSRRKQSRPDKRSSEVNSSATIEPSREASQKVLENFMERLSVNPVKRSRLIQVSFESQDPELAAQVVNTLTSNYIDHIIEERRQSSQEASEWLLEQLETAKASLEKAEKDLQAYVRDSGLEFLDAENTSESLVNRRLRQLQAELTSAEVARYKKESLYQLVEAGNYGSLPGVFETKFMGDLTVRLAELKRQHAQLSTTFTVDYPTVKQVQNQIDEIEVVLVRERERGAQQITNEYLAALRREELVRQAFEGEQEQAKSISSKLVQYNILKREVGTNKSLYAGLRDNLKRTVVSADWNASSIRVVDSAEPPLEPVRPIVWLNLSLAVVTGLGLGVGAAFLQEYLDVAVRTFEDVEHSLHIPTLALIPSVDSLNVHRSGVDGLYDRAKTAVRAEGKSTVKLVTQWHRIDQDGQQRSALAEAFRSLRTSVLLSTPGRHPRSLLVTSAEAGDGKTTIATNLAMSLAYLGERVLLIDGDMRRPCIHSVFHIEEKPGLASYLSGQPEWQSMVRHTGLPGLDALVCGPVPSNPADLLFSERMRTLIREAIGGYSYVVLDSPPLLEVADSRILAVLVEGVVLVIRGGVTSHDVAREAQNYVRSVGGNLIGAVLNNVDIRADDYYGHYYPSNYDRTLDKV